jgi:hypothetical protein
LRRRFAGHPLLDRARASPECGGGRAAIAPADVVGALRGSQPFRHEESTMTTDPKPVLTSSASPQDRARAAISRKLFRRLARQVVVEEHAYERQMAEQRAQYETKHRPRTRQAR